MATDVERSVAFYRDVLGFSVSFTVTADRETRFDGTATGAVFAILEWDGAQLMLQDAKSLAEELPAFEAGLPKAPGGAIYLQGLDPDAIAEAVDPAILIKGPETTWYGMRETYIRDPDGHILCAGVAVGPPPAPGPNNEGAEA
jgi:catechol 2,3-dioxygenase-like lactoylglutathione lyase family enzyme